MLVANYPTTSRGGLRQTLHGDAVVAENIGLAAGHRVLVGYADDAQRHSDTGLHEHGGTRFAQTAVYRMFLDCDNRAALATGSGSRPAVSKGLMVCMLSTRHSTPSSASAPAAKGRERTVSPVAMKRDIGSLAKHDCLAQLKVACGR